VLSVRSDHALLCEETVCSCVAYIFFFFFDTRRAMNAMTTTTSTTAPPIRAKLTTAGEPEVDDVVLVSAFSAPLLLELSLELLDVVVVDGAWVAVVDVPSLELA
jgi:hypothetical protein